MAGKNYEEHLKSKPSLDPETSKARRRQAKKVLRGKIPKELAQAGVESPTVDESAATFSKFTNRQGMPSDYGVAVGRAMNIADQYDTLNKKRAMEKEAALSMKKGGKVRGAGIAQKGIKKCKMVKAK